MYIRTGSEPKVEDVDEKDLEADILNVIKEVDNRNVFPSPEQSLGWIIRSIVYLAFIIFHCSQQFGRILFKLFQNISLDKI